MSEIRVRLITPQPLVVKNAAPSLEAANVALAVAPAWATGNAAFTAANTSNAIALLAFSQANGAWLQANSGGQANAVAYAAFDQANGSWSTANNVYAQSNTVYAQVNSAYAQANTSNSTSSLGYLHASNAYDVANAAYDDAMADTLTRDGVYTGNNIFVMGLRLGNSGNVYIASSNTNTIIFGNTDNGPTTAESQILSVHSSYEIEDTAGAAWYIRGSGSTGTGEGGPIEFQVTESGSTGSDANPHTTILKLGANTGSMSMGFFGATDVNQQTITGSKASGAALESLLAALVNYGLIIDTSSA